MTVRANKPAFSIREKLKELTVPRKVEVPCLFWVQRKNTYTSSTSYSVMVYDDVKLNFGDCYDSSDGSFTVPATGLYELAWASIAHNANTVYRYVLHKNGSNTWDGGVYELRLDNNASGAEYAPNGEFCVYLELNKGDVLNVRQRNDAGSYTTVYGNPNYLYTYFRGRILKQY